LNCLSNGTKSRLQLLSLLSRSSTRLALLLLSHLLTTLLKVEIVSCKFFSGFVSAQNFLNSLGPFCKHLDCFAFSSGLSSSKPDVVSEQTIRGICSFLNRLSPSALAKLSSNPLGGNFVAQRSGDKESMSKEKTIRGTLQKALQLALKEHNSTSYDIVRDLEGVSVLMSNLTLPPEKMFLQAKSVFDKPLEFILHALLDSKQ
jgi:hypothetical protein